MNSPLWVSVIWLITTVTALSIICEAAALIMGWTTHLPLRVRAAVLGWIFVLGHIFWGFC